MIHPSQSDVAEARAPAIPAGMVPWAGGNSAPADWDGGDTLLRGQGEEDDDLIYPGHLHTAHSWKWNPNDPSIDIIAYTPRPAARPATTDRLREAVMSLLPFLRHNSLCAVLGGYDHGCACGRDNAEQNARAALSASPVDAPDLTDDQWRAALERAPKPEGPLTPIAPDEWVLVPREPNEAMIHAAKVASCTSPAFPAAGAIQAQWSAMLAASQPDDTLSRGDEG